MSETHPERPVDVPQVDFDIHTGDALTDQDASAPEDHDTDTDKEQS